MFPSFLMGRIVRAVPALCDADRVRAAEAFLEPRAAKLEGVEKDLRQSVEEGMRCAALADAERDEASRWLRAGIYDRSHAPVGSGLRLASAGLHAGCDKIDDADVRRLDRAGVRRLRRAACSPGTTRGSIRRSVRPPRAPPLRSSVAPTTSLSLPSRLSRTYYYDAVSGMLVAIVDATAPAPVTRGAFAGPYRAASTLPDVRRAPAPSRLPRVPRRRRGDGRDRD